MLGVVGSVPAEGGFDVARAVPRGRARRKILVHRAEELHIGAGESGRVRAGVGRGVVSAAGGGRVLHQSRADLTEVVDARRGQARAAVPSWSAGRRRDARMAMMKITTRSSISVKALERFILAPSWVRRVRYNERNRLFNACRYLYAIKVL